MSELNRERIVRNLEHLVDKYGENGSYNTYCTLSDSLTLIKELTEERDALEQHNSYLKGLIDIAFVKELQSFDEKSAAKAVAEAEMWRMIALREKQLVEENEKLNAEIHEWRNLVKVLNQNNAELETELAQTYDLLDESKADTVRKFLDKFKDWPSDDQEYIERYAKEILEENK